MKKMILFCTMVCAAGQLYGMMEKAGLPKELHNEILMTALAASDNLKTFNALLDALTKKYPNAAREEVAKKINTPTAKKYLEVNDAVFDKVSRTRMSLNELEKAIAEGADPNYTYLLAGNKHVSSILETASKQVLLAISAEDEEGFKIRILMVKFLLDQGANPYAISSTGRPFIEQQQISLQKGWVEDDRLFKLLQMYAKKYQ